VTLTFDLQNLTRLSVRASEYSQVSFVKTVQAAHEILGNSIGVDKWTNERTNKCDTWTTQKHNAFTDTVGWQRHK